MRAVRRLAGVACVVAVLFAAVPAQAALPPIKHVFVIVLENKNYDEAFGPNSQAPFLAKNVSWAAQTQVGHWMTVLADWKTQLGADWDKTYAASNTIYVARQNNVLFSVLAQFFGPDAINSRLLLIETVSFTTTPSESTAPRFPTPLPP